MQTRSLSGLSKNCPVIAFGAWGIGGATPGGTSYGDISEQDAHGCIDAAYIAGMRLFDTSPAYGYGNSEHRLGEALTRRRGDVIIATKGGLYDYGAGADFSAGTLDSELDASLKRLKTEHVDIFQLHNPPADLAQNDGLRTFLDNITRDGRATTVGISVKSPADAFSLLDAYPFTAVQVNLNMLDVRALTSGLLDRCAEQNISVLARTPLCFGFLSLAVDENTEFAASDHRAHWSREQLALWASGARDAQAIVARHDPANTSLAARALRFGLLHPAVKTVLTGPMTAVEARENAAAGSLPPLDANCLKDVLALNAETPFFVRN